MELLAATVIVPGVVSSKRDVIPPNFFSQGLKINAAYEEVLERVVRSWVESVSKGTLYQQDSASSLQAKISQHG